MTPIARMNSVQLLLFAWQVESASNVLAQAIVVGQPRIVQALEIHAKAAQETYGVRLILGLLLITVTMELVSNVLLLLEIA